jgi:hypothetical protein
VLSQSKARNLPLAGESNGSSEAQAAACRLPARIFAHRPTNRPPKPLGGLSCWDARGGSAERGGEAIPPRALVSTEREAGEAYAQHSPGRRFRDRGELESLEPVVNTTLPNV